jgi:hypothetical protein
MSAYLGKDKLIFDPAAMLDSDNIGSFTRAGSDGQPISWTNVGLAFAAFSGLVAGLTTPVVITADVAGPAGNITLIADSITDVAGLIAAHNLLFPANALTLTSGIGTQVPTANIILSGGSLGKDGLDVYVLNQVAISDPSNHAEDSAHVSGDMGKFVLGVRNDSNASLTSNDGDYSPLAVDEFGRLKVTADLVVTSDFVYAEDSAHADGALGAFTLGVVQASLAASVSADGDYGAFKLDNRGAMWVAPVGTAADDAADSENPVKIGSKSIFGALAAISNTGDRADLISDKYRRAYVNNGANIATKPSGVSVTTSATALPATALAGRRQIMIQNLHNKEIFIGDSAVSSSNGLRVAAGATLTLEVGEDVIMYGIVAAGTAACRVLELA